MEIVKNEEDWNRILQTHFKELRDIYFEYDYFDLYSKTYNAKPKGIFWEDDNVKVYWPHLIRDVWNIELFKNYNYYDLITPYGYGGPLVSEKVAYKVEIRKSIKKFLDEYKKFSQGNKYIRN